MAHSHEALEADGVGPLLAHRVLVAVVALAVVATLAGLALLWPAGRDTGIGQFLGAPAELDSARVRAVRTVPCAGTEEAQGVRCRSASVELTTGADAGTVVEIEASEGPGAPQLAEGDRIVVGYAPDAPPGLQYYFADFERRSSLL